MHKTASCLTFDVKRDDTHPWRFFGVAYSGGVIPQYGSFGDACIDLSSVKLPDSEIFALVDHDHSKRAGKIRATMKGSVIWVDGEIFQSTAAGQEVAALMAEGAPWQMSVGIQADIKKASQSTPIQCNGKTLAVNTIFSNAALREVSFVPVGADPNTSVTAFSRNLALTASPEIPQPEGNDMTIEELQKQVNSLSADLAAEKTARQQAEDNLKQIKLAARQAAIAQLSADMPRELSADETSVLQSLEDGAFTTMSATLKSFKPIATTAQAHLFTEQATDGRQANPKEAELIKARATLMNQVGGKAA